MQDKEKQIKNSFIYLLPTLVGNILPLITLPIFTRVLSQEDFGALALAQAYGIFVTGLANFGLLIVYERNFFEYAKDDRKKSSLLYSILLFVMCAFIMCGVLTFFLSDSLSRWLIGSEAHGRLIFWSFCAAGFMSLKLYYLTYFKNMEDAKSFTWYTIDENILGFAFSLLFVVFLKIGVMGIPYGQILASLIVFVLLNRRFLKILPFTLDWNLLRGSLKISYPLTPRLFLGVIGTQFDKYMIALMATIGGVGIYSIGQKIAYVVFVAMSSVQNVFAPQVYKRMFELGEQGGNAVGQYLTPFAYLSTAIALLILLFSEEVLLLLTPASYHGAIPIVMILSLFYASLFFGKQPQLLFAKKTHMTSVLTVVGIALNVVINIPFIMKWGALGAAWGTLLSGLLSGAISFVVSQRYYRIGWEYKKIAAIYLVPAAAFVVLLFMMNLKMPYSERLGTKLIFLGAYVLLGVKLNIISVDNFILLKKSSGLSS